jgi:hypothetical protein
MLKFMRRRISLLLISVLSVSAFQPFASADLPFQSAFQTAVLATPKLAAAGFQSGTNAEKLGGAWSVGTEYHVTDGFVVSGSGSTGLNGKFFRKGGTLNGKDSFAVPGYEGTGTLECAWTGAAWFLTNEEGFAYLHSGSDPWSDEFVPDDAPAPAPTLTHPAVQTRIAASTAQGGVAVVGGIQDGVYTPRGTNDGNSYYVLLGQPDFGADGGFYAIWFENGAGWHFSDSDGVQIYYSFSDVATPDLAGTDKMAMLDNGVGGGLLSGIVCFKNGTLNSRTRYVSSDTTIYIQWSGTRWEGWNENVDGLTVYSTSDVATPDLATNWKLASDDSSVGFLALNVAWFKATDGAPASITVTSVSLGELYAGLRVTNDGVTNGSSCVSAPFHGRQYYMGLLGGGSNNMHWDTDFNVWTDDNGAWSTSNVVFPWQGTDNGGGHTGATFSRNDVANEANWQVVP